MKYFLIFILTFYPSSRIYARNLIIKKISQKKFIQLVLNNSPAIKASEYELQKYEALLKGSNMLYYPLISLNMQAAPSHKYKCIMPDAWFQAADKEGLSDKEFREKYCIATDRDDSITYDLDGYVAKFQISAIFPLYTFGKIKYAKQIAKNSVGITSYKNEIVQRKIKYLALRAYHARQASLYMGKLMGKIEKYVEKAKEKAEEYEENDKISQTDLLRLKLGENELKIKKLDIVKIQNISLNAMKLLAGQAVDVNNINAPKSKNTLPPPLEELLKKAKKNRVEFKVLKEARALSEARIGLAKAAFYPDLGVFAKYTYILSNSDDPKSVYSHDSLHGNSLSLGIGLKLKINPSTMITELRIARIERRNIEIKFQIFKDKLMNKIQNKRTEIIFILKKLQLINNGIRLSRGWLTLLNMQEKANVVKPKETVDALVSYFKLKTQKQELLYKLSEARLSLSEICGEKK